MKIGNQGDGGGRPIVEFTPEQITQLEALAAVLTKGQIADYFSISETTLRAIEDRQPEVSDAYKKGRVPAADLFLWLLADGSARPFYLLVRY